MHLEKSIFEPGHTIAHDDSADTALLIWSDRKMPIFHACHAVQGFLYLFFLETCL